MEDDLEPWKMMNDFAPRHDNKKMSEQFLFSCLCSKVTVFRPKWQWFFVTSSLAAAAPVPLTLEFIEMVPCSKISAPKT